MVTRDAEVGIVGAGPAGARAAELLASQGVDVLLLDPRAPWEKPCGGGLTPPAFQELPELDELASVCRVTTGARIWSPGGLLEVPLGRPIRMISRRTLGAWQLARATAAGARHEPLKVIGVRRTDGGWRLRTSAGDRVVRVVIGADGAASVVRRAVAPALQVELAPTRVRYPRGEAPHPEASYLRFLPEIAGYLWDFPRVGHRSVGVMATRPGWNRARMDEEIDGYLASEGGASPDDERAGAVIGTAQLGHGDYRALAGDDFALLGDAAGLADPLTGEGIRNALRSGGLLAEAWREGGVARYPRLARTAFGWEFRTARRWRRVLLDRGGGAWMVRRASEVRVVRALMEGCLDALAESDLGTWALCARWWRAARRDPSRRTPVVGP